MGMLFLRVWQTCLPATSGLREFTYHTHSPCIPCLDFVQMVSSTWEGLCHQPPPAVEFPLTWDGDTHDLPGRPSLITSRRSAFLALEVPKHFACPSVMVLALSALQEAEGCRARPSSDSSRGRLPEWLTQYMCSCLWIVFSHPEIERLNPYRFVNSSLLSASVYISHF